MYLYNMILGNNFLYDQKVKVHYVEQIIQINIQNQYHAVSFVKCSEQNRNIKIESY